MFGPELNRVFCEDTGIFLLREFSGPGIFWSEHNLYFIVKCNVIKQGKSDTETKIRYFPITNICAPSFGVLQW